jgi:YVTN family beta-propeller protein
MREYILCLATLVMEAAPHGRGGAALGIVLVMGLGLMASPAEAQPFAYVTTPSSSFNSVTVIDTATNTPVTTIPVGSGPYGVAVTPDGKYVYVAYHDSFPANVSVIDTATNTVVATIGAGSHPFGVAISPDGKTAYVANESDNSVSVINTATYAVATIPPVAGLSPFGNPIGVAVTPDGKYVYVTNDVSTSSNVSVIDTATNTVVATVPVGSGPVGIAIAPDGKYAYVANSVSDNISVINTATNTVVATVALGAGNTPFWLAITPDGKLAYVTIPNSSIVSVIDTASNTVVATVGVGVAPIVSSPHGVAITPDGKHAYVAAGNPSTVSVIDTASNTVESTMISVAFPGGVAIIPPPVGVPFLAFSATLTIDLGGPPPEDTFNLHSSFTLSSTASSGINPVTEPVTLQVGTFTTIIPPRSFTKLAQERVFHLRGSDRWREPGRANQAHGHLALRVPRQGTGRELDRDHEPGDGDAEHRRRQRHDLGHGKDFPLKMRASGRDSIELNRITP